MYRYGQMTQSEIGKQVGGVGYSRVSQLRTGFLGAVEADRRVRDLWLRAQQLITND